MKKLTILVDMDDTIENLCEAWVNELNKRHGTGVVAEDICEWDMEKNFPSLTPQQIYAPLCEKSFWDTVRPIAGAQQALLKLKEDGHRVVIVTASHPDTVSYKMNGVLFKYFPFLTYKDVVIASQKDLIVGDVMIDDNPANFDRKRITEGLNILFAAPHNEMFDAYANGMVRANTWNDVMHCISMYSCIVSVK